MKKILVALISLLCAMSALADELKLPQPTPDETKEAGWNYGLQLGVTTNWNYDYRYVGVADGHYLSIGGKFAARANYRDVDQDFRNTFSILETFNDTPALGSIVKAADDMLLESVYLWACGGWWGFFGQASAEAPIFEGRDVRAATVTYSITDINGNALTPVTGNSLTLTSMFLPFTLKEAGGAFVKPFAQEDFTLDVKGGIAFRQTFANNQLVITGQAGNTVSVGTLADFYQIGPVIAALAHGDLMDKMLHYEAGADVSYAALDASAKAIGSDLGSRINLELMAKLSFKFADWLALSWDGKALRIPNISTDVQIQSNLLLTFNYTI